MASSSQGASPPVPSQSSLALPQFDSASKLSTVEFETGNPSAGAIIRGTLTLGGNWESCLAVCVEGVPGIMTSADFCVFIRPEMDSVMHLRLLRPSSEPNKYMVVAHLKPSASAYSFALALAGRPYLQGLVAETCRVRPVQQAIFHGVSSSGDEFPWRALFSDAKKIEAACTAPEGEEVTKVLVEKKSEAGILDATCAVCLERLAGSALVTTLCNHTLHAACLAQCELNRCPVCRHAHELTPEASVCMSCTDGRDVWMCVVCAYVGCGKYRNKHAYAHFLETHHPFAMNLNELVFWSGERVPASSVWDYISERFVDRLLASEDGKVVELGAGSAASSAPAPRKSCCTAPAAAPASTDFSNDAALQAAVVESRLEHAVAQERAREECKRAELEERAERAEKEASTARRARADALKEKKSASRRAEAAEKEAAVLREKNGFLKNLNETLLRDQAEWRKRVDAFAESARAAQEERDALRDQLRDLMVHLEAQSSINGAAGTKIEQCRSGAGPAAAELAGGDVLRVQPSPRERLAIKLNRRVER